MEAHHIKKKKTRIALVVASFDASITDVMTSSARNAIDEAHGRVGSFTQVTGAYEIPLAAKHALRNPLIDAVVALGWIEKGETLHGEIMGYVVHEALIRLQLEYDKPVGLGIIGPGATMLQARNRARDTAKRAVQAACLMNALINSA
ncbi:6,7-dimethyl-8-ribityllumazine synthase [Candidatus Uhrbacteria bacterium]|nr:6,7-dimethyl-8-ribityllumazine synthase [Candidatus Uhrbacteria bacterium]